MKSFCFCLSPLEFHIHADCDTPEEALRQALRTGTSGEIYLLDYLHKNIEDYPTLDGSVECLYVEDFED